MATISKVLFYLDDEASFPYEMSFADVLGNTGISTSEGYTIIPEIRSADNLTIRMINFAPPPSSPGSRFGSILGICYIYDNGVKSWIESVSRTGPNSLNLSVGLGSWLEGLTLTQARAHANYRKPYIGYVTENDYVEYKIQAYQDPPPPHNALSITLAPKISNIRIGQSVTFLGTLAGDDKSIADYGWSFNSNPPSINIVDLKELQGTVKFNVPGSYEIRLQITNNLGEISYDTATVIVAQPAGVQVNIIQENQNIYKGDTLKIDVEVTSEVLITERSWSVDTGVDIQTSNDASIILNFNKLGTYTIKYTAKNAEGSSGQDSMIITVVEPPKKRINASAYLSTSGNNIPIDPSIVLNSHNINPDNFMILFKNTGESIWNRFYLQIDVGKESLVFIDGSASQDLVQVVSINGELKFPMMIYDFESTNKYAFVLKAIIEDQQGQKITRFYELKWIANAKAEYALEIAEKREDNYQYPNTMKRNARYRGHRESEKVLSDNQEQLLDIRINHIDIQKINILENNLIKTWFSGEIGDLAENITYSAMKTLDTLPDKTSYLLPIDVVEGKLSALMISLNEAVLVSPSDYVIQDGSIVLKSNVSEKGTMEVEYTVTVSVMNQRMIGQSEISERMGAINEKIGNMERRYNDYESAYK